VPPNVFPGCDALVNGKHFDALDPRGALWEIKTDNWTNYTPFLKQQTVQNHLAEAEREARIASDCGYPFIFAVADENLYQELRNRVRSPTIRLRHVPQCRRQIVP
jgi:hypothetical protein